MALQWCVTFASRTQKTFFFVAVTAFCVLWSLSGLCAGKIEAVRKAPTHDNKNHFTTEAMAKSVSLLIDGNSHSHADIRRIALVIGNSSYLRVPKLPNSKHDAADLCEQLRMLRFDVSCLYDVLSKRELREAIRTFTWKLDARTAAFFFYAGHGVQLNGQNYLLPTGINARTPLDIEKDALSLSYLLRSLGERRSSPNIVILDACRENPFPRGGNTTAPGLARIEPPIGTMLVYATAPDGVALDGTGRNGLFTKHFMKHLSTPGKKIDELFQMVAKDVEDEAKILGMEQVPYRSSSYSGAFCLAGCEDPQLAAEIEQIKQQRFEASERITLLTQENDNLKQQANERSQKINELDTRIAKLAGEALSVGKKNSHAPEEMEQLKAMLAATKREQSEAEQAKQNAAAREKEIKELKRQMTELQRAAQQLDQYRQKLTSLQGQSDQTSRKMETLIEENKRLKALSDDKTANVMLLEDRIAQLLDTNKKGTQSADQLIELNKLRARLEVARAEQEEIESLKSLASARETEIFQLKERMALLQKKSQELESSRQQTFPSKASIDKKQKTFFVPSF